MHVDPRPSLVRARTRRPGLTLIELIVVLMILIALAGILIPMLPGMLGRAHNSTCATNIGETTRAIITYQQLYSQYPNNWDALGDGTKIIDYFANGAALPASQGGPGTNPGNGELTALTLTAAEASALTGTGITTVQAMVPTFASAPAGFDPTFNNYSSTTPATGAVAIKTGTVLAGLDPANNANALARCITFNLSTTGRFVVLGVGPRNSMIGKTVQSAPVHFPDQTVINPEYAYMRFCAIFRVSDSAVGANITQATLVGVAPIMDSGLGGIDDHLQGWFQQTIGGG